MDILTAKYIIKAAAAADDTVILEGPHGVGKSDACKQIQKEENYHMETLFLSHQEVGDLIGIPHTIIAGDTTITTWSVPVWLHRMREAAATGKKCMLFLDELNRAPLDVRQSAMQLVLERQIHEHKLPTVDDQRCLVVAAINPSDEYQVDELDPALMDRFLYAAIEVNTPTWLDWARLNKVNSVVRDFIAVHPDRLHWTPEDGIGATPRSWTKLGDHMDNIASVPEDVVFQIMKGKVGTEVGAQFYAFYKNYSKVIKIGTIEDIIAKSLSATNIEDIADVISNRIIEYEAIQKTELTNQFLDKYKCSEQPKELLNLLIFLYALEVEICIAFLKDFRVKDKVAYSALASLDNEINDKKLFRRIVVASMVD